MAITFDPYTGQYVRTGVAVPTGFLPTYGEANPENPPGTMLGRAIGRGVDAIQRNLGSSVEGVGRSTGWDGLAQYGADVAAANQREIEQSAALERDGGITGYLADLTGSNLPQFAVSVGLPLLGRVAGGAIGSLGGPVGAGVGQQLGMMAGTAASGLFNFGQLAGENREAQKAADMEAGRPVEVDEAAAFGAAIPGAAAETLSGVIGGRLATGFLKGGTTTKFLSKATAANAGRAVAAGGLAEAPTEIIQQGLTMLQSGADMTPIEAAKELAEAGLGGFLLGGMLGGVSSTVGDYNAVRRAKAEEVRNADLQRALDEKLKPENMIGPRQPDMQIAAPRGTARVISEQGDEVERPFQDAPTEQLVQGLTAIEARMASGGSITQNDAVTRRMLRAELDRRDRQAGQALAPEQQAQLQALNERLQAPRAEGDTAPLLTPDEIVQREQLMRSGALPGDQKGLFEEVDARAQAVETMRQLAKQRGLAESRFLRDLEVTNEDELLDRVLDAMDEDSTDGAPPSISKLGAALGIGQNLTAQIEAKTAERDAAAEAASEASGEKAVEATRTFRSLNNELKALINQRDRLSAAMTRFERRKAEAAIAAQPVGTQMDAFSGFQPPTALPAAPAAAPVAAPTIPTERYAAGDVTAQELGEVAAAMPRPSDDDQRRLPLSFAEPAVPFQGPDRPLTRQPRLPTMGRLPKQDAPQRLDAPQPEVDPDAFDPNAAMGSLLDRPVEPQALLQAAKMADPAGAVGEQLKSGIPSAVRRAEFLAAEGQRLEQRAPVARAALADIEAAPPSVVGIKRVNPITAQVDLSRGRPMLLQQRTDSENTTPGWYTQDNVFVGRSLSEARTALNEAFAAQSDVAQPAPQDAPAQPGKPMTRAMRRERMLREKAEREARENSVRFSRNDGAAVPGIPATAARSAVSRITNGWRGGPAVEVVQSAADIDYSTLPDNLTAEAVGTSPGFYARGRVYIIADNLRDADHAVSTLYHESLGHFGFRQRYANALNGVLLKMYEENGMVRDWVDQWRASGRVQNWSDLPLHEQIEEALAMQSETGPMPLKLFDRLITAIVEFARAMGIRVKLTNSDIRAIVNDAHNFGMETRAPLNEAEVRLLEIEAEEAAARFEMTPQFSRWFGNSVVKDAVGRPIWVFHGTRSDFTVFRRDALGENELGFHVGTVAQANQFAMRGVKNKRDITEIRQWGELLEPYETPNVMPLYARLENPIRLQDGGNWHPHTLARQLRRQGGKMAQLASQLDAYRDGGGVSANDFAMRIFRRAGYDGAVYLNRVEGLSEDDIVRYMEMRTLQKIDPANPEEMDEQTYRSLFPSAQESYILFDANQLKSSTGNSGDYSRNNNDIRFSRNDAEAARPAADRANALGQYRMEFVPEAPPELVKPAVAAMDAAVEASSGDTPRAAEKGVAKLMKAADGTLGELKKTGSTASAKLRRAELYLTSLGHHVAKFGKYFEHAKGNYLKDLLNYNKTRVALRQRVGAFAVKPYEMYETLRSKLPDVAKKIRDLMSMTQFQINPRKSWSEHTWLHNHPEAETLRRHVDRANNIYRAISPEARAIYDAADKTNKALHMMQMTTGLFNLINAEPAFAARVPAAKQQNPMLQWQQTSSMHDNPDKSYAFFATKLQELIDQSNKVISEVRGVKQGDAAAAAALSNDVAQRIVEIEANVEAMERAPYFHLGRFGDYSVRMELKTKDGTTGKGAVVDPAASREVAKRLEQAGLKGVRLDEGNTSATVFLRFDTPLEAESIHRVALQLEKEGLLRSAPVKKDRRDEDTLPMVTDRVIESLREALSAELDDGQAETPEGKAARKLIGMLNRIYIERLPDISSAKVMVHRDNVPGMSEDDMRSYAFRAEVAANALANMTTASTLTQAFGGMRQMIGEAQERAGQDAFIMQDVMNEALIKEADQPANEGYTVIDKLRAFNHAYFLGLSPAYFFTQFTQLGALLWPELTKSFGAKESLEAVARSTAVASKIVTATIKGATAGGWKTWADATITPEVLDGLVLDKNPKKNEELKEFIMYMVNSGTIDIGAPSRELGRAAEGRLTDGTEIALRYASSLGFYAEMTTRLSAALATRELVEKRFGDWKFEKKMDFIQTTIDQSMLNYTSWYVSRAMGKTGMFGQFTPLVMAFQTYTAQLIEKLMRELNDGFVVALTDYYRGRNVSDAEAKARAASRRFMYSHMTAITVLAGSLGLPGVTVFAAALDALLGDDEEPYDSKAAWRNFLADTFGPEVGEVLSRGVTRAVGFDISTRTGEADIIPFSKLIADKRDWQTATEEWALRSLGSPFSMIGGIIGGGKEIMNGNVLEGMTQALPVAFRGLANSYKLTEQGYVDRQGNPLPMEAGTLDVLYQALGFSPAERAEYTEANLAQDSRRGQLMRAARNIRKNLAEAIERGDQEDAMRWMQEAQTFDASNPGYEVLPGVGTTLRQRARAQAMSMGTMLPIGTNIRDPFAAELTSFANLQR